MRRSRHDAGRHETGAADVRGRFARTRARTRVLAPADPETDEAVLAPGAHGLPIRGRPPRDPRARYDGGVNESHLRSNRTLAGLPANVHARTWRGALHAIVALDMIAAAAWMAFALVNVSDTKIVLLALLLTPLVFVDIGVWEGSSSAVYARGIIAVMMSFFSICLVALLVVSGFPDDGFWIVAGCLAASAPALFFCIAAHRALERIEATRPTSAALLNRETTLPAPVMNKPPRPGIAWS